MTLFSTFADSDVRAVLEVIGCCDQAGPTKQFYNVISFTKGGTTAVFTRH
jgi:hypothetical protein